MKKILLTIAALSIAAPAAAQPWRGQRTQSADLQMQIDAGVRSGAITPRELVPLRDGLRELVQLERQFGVNGIDAREQSALQVRSNALRQQIGMAQGAGNGGFGNGGFGNERRARWEENYDREHRAQWEERYMSDRSAAWEGQYGRSDRGYDSDDRFDEGNRGDRFAGDVRIGQRATRRMAALPDQYRGQYRDSDQVYYRYDEDRIYEISRQTGLILRLFDVTD